VVEGAKGAIDVADIGVVHIPVDNEAHLGRIVVSVPHPGGGQGQFGEAGPFQQVQSFLLIDALARVHPIQDRPGFQQQGFAHGTL